MVSSCPAALQFVGSTIFGSLVLLFLSEFLMLGRSGENTAIRLVRLGSVLLQLSALGIIALQDDALWMSVTLLVVVSLGILATCGFVVSRLVTRKSL